MWPWGHLVLGYAGYLLVRPAARKRADRLTVVALVVGTQFADLVDKPLGWWLGVLPSGRSLAHSVLVAALVVAVVAVVADRWGRPGIGGGFGFGYASHLLGDALVPLWQGSPDELTFLLWPLLPPPPYDEPVDLAGVIAFLRGTELSPLFLAELGVATLVGGALLYHFWYRTSVDPPRPRP
jgi:hypothetical protein